MPIYVQSFMDGVASFGGSLYSFQLGIYTDPKRVLRR